MHVWKFFLIFKKKIQSQHSSDSSDSSNSSHSSHSSSFEEHYFFFASIRSIRRFVARFSIMYNLLRVMWCWAMTRNRSSFIIWFEFAIASRMLKETQAKNETRLRCDSKKREKDRIRRRSKEKEDRIRRRSKKKRIAFDDVRRKKRTIAFDDVVVVDSKTQRMTRNSNRWFVCERIRLRRRRRLHIWLMSQNTKNEFFTNHFSNYIFFLQSCNDNWCRNLSKISTSRRTFEKFSRSFRTTRSRISRINLA